MVNGHGRREDAPMRFRQSVELARIAVMAIGAQLALANTAYALGCFPIAQNSQNVIQAAYQPVAVPDGSTVQITYLGHSSFHIETSGGATAVTDYNGYMRPAETPKLVTMNNAHSTHYTDLIDPEIQNVLRGWNPAGGLAEHDVMIEDMRVRNVPTSVHGRVGDQTNSNSIFVFEVEDLCIAHLGHLHHILTDTHLAELGVIDILMVPIDGGWTMAQQDMAHVVKQINPGLVLPMHAVTPPLVARFAQFLGGNWQVTVSEQPSIALSRKTLPYREVRVMPSNSYGFRGLE